MARKGRRGQRATASPTPPSHATLHPHPDATASRLALVVTVLAGIVPLGVYVATLTPTVAGGDAGEMITVAYLLGVAHPPGYPLYTLLAKLASLVPFGTVAWRVNLFSALAGSAATLLLCRGVIRWTGDVAAGALAAGVFAFGPLVWPYAITAEVFALNNLFTAGLIYFAARASNERTAAGAVSSRTLNLAALWLGLGFAHHHILVFLGIPYALFLLALTGRRVTSPRMLASFAGMALLGMTPYLYLVVASGHAPVTWGDTATFDGFLTHFLRREYGTFRLAESSVGSEGGLGTRLALFWSAAGRSTWWAHVPLALAALISLRRSGPARWLTTLWVVALLFYVVVFSMLANARLEDPLHIMVQERFWQQALVVLSALMGVGLAELGRWLSPWRASWVRWAPAIALPVALIVTEASAVRAYQQHFVQDYGAAILQSLPPNAILIISSDEAVNSVRYLQYVAGDAARRAGHPRWLPDERLVSSLRGPAPAGCAASGGAWPAADRRPVHLSRVRRCQRAAPRLHREPRAVAALAGGSVLAVADRRGRARDATLVPARPRHLRGGGGGVLRATRSGRGSRLPARELGSRYPQRLLETVRALRLRGRSPRGRPHRQSGSFRDGGACVRDDGRAPPLAPRGRIQEPRRRLSGSERHPARCTGRDGARVEALPGDGTGR